MSYYYRNPYQFSYHGVARIRTRLKLQDLTDMQVREHCLKLISESHNIEETRSYKYIRVNKTNLYFVIKKDTNLILTISPMSPTKLLKVIEENL
ncbi:hypothetical protein [Spiroplasma endosymbiont of Nebria brevicollis]|uniref:hypothetical protein n=1 Tax=Spiroplasma endosymbiont of Nebria brevicollis TaxID=3066284 RepID=UPI00313D8131